MGQAGLDIGRASARHIQVRDSSQKVAQALRLGEHHQHRPRRHVDCATQLSKLGALCLDAQREKRLMSPRARDLDVEISDLRRDLVDLPLEDLLLRGVLLQRLLQLLLGGHCVREVAPELRADLIDGRLLLLWIGRCVGGGGRPVGSEQQARQDKSDQGRSHVSICLRRLINDDPEPRPRPTRTTDAAAMAATVVVKPGANWVNVPAAAETPVNANPKVTAAAPVTTLAAVTPVWPPSPPGYLGCRAATSC